MADKNPGAPSTPAPQANRARPGLGEGRGDLDAERAASRDLAATDPKPPLREVAPAPSEPLDDRNAAGVDDVQGDLGAGTPPNVDIHKIGQEDRPQEDWGDPAGEGAVFSSNNTRRGPPAEAQRGQGVKTRTANKNRVSRRG